VRIEDIACKESENLSGSETSDAGGLWTSRMHRVFGNLPVLWLTAEYFDPSNR